MGQSPGVRKPATEDPTASIGTLLEQIERESVPERLLELAKLLQEALDARRRTGLATQGD